LALVFSKTISKRNGTGNRIRPTNQLLVFYFGEAPLKKTDLFGSEHALGSGSGVPLKPECGMVGVRHSSFSHAQNQVHDSSASVW